MTRSACSLLALLLLAAPLPGRAAIQTDPGAGVHQLDSGSNFVGKGKGGKLAGFFTPEQRAILMRQERGDMQNMTPDEKKAYRKTQTAKILAMSETDRQKLKMGLQTQWDALPQKQKARIEQNLATRENGQAD
jgi:hypothetical protein